MPRGYMEGPAADEAERRLDELERGVEEPTEERLAVFGSTADDPEKHFIGWRDDVDPDELFASGRGLGPLRRPPTRPNLLSVSTFVLIHGGGDVGWYWHLVEAELRRRGHDVVAPDLPGDDESAGLDDYADAVVEAVGDRKDLVVVGHSFGAFTAPLVADRLAG